MREQSVKGLPFKLIYWMEQTDKTYRLTLPHADKDAVHDLRVAIRRCRTILSGLQWVCQEPILKEIKRYTRVLFRKAGHLRNAQVLAEWNEHFTKLRLPHCNYLAKVLAGQERITKRKFMNVTKGFSIKKWRRLLQAVRAKNTEQALPQKDLLRIAGLRSNEVERLHRAAAEHPKEAAYHRLRIAFKKLRYTLESGFPKIYRHHQPYLVRIQDLLGEHHDLERFREFLGKFKKRFPRKELRLWKKEIAREQVKRIRAYREVTRRDHGRKIGKWFAD